MTFDEIGKALGKDEVWVAAAFYGQVRFISLSFLSSHVNASCLNQPLGKIRERGPRKARGSVGCPSEPLEYVTRGSLVAKQRTRAHPPYRSRHLSPLRGTFFPQDTWNQ